MASNMQWKSVSSLTKMMNSAMILSCDKHNEPIKFFCESHNTAFCHPCASEKHQNPCRVEDLDHVIKQLRRAVEEKVLDIEKSKEQFRNFETQIASCRKMTSNYLESLRDEVETAFGRKLFEQRDKESNEVRVINKDAEEEIHAINAKREERLKKCREDAEQRRKPIQDSKLKLLEDIDKISRTVQTEVDGLQEDTQSTLRVIHEGSDDISDLLKDNKDLVSNAHRVMASIEQTLRRNAKHGDLDKITLAVKNVKFITGKVRGEFCGRIGGYIGKRELADTIDIPPALRFPILLGIISDSEVAMTDMLVCNYLYTTNLKSRETDMVIEEISNEEILTCSSLVEKIVASGMTDGTGDSLKGCIKVYNRKGKLIKDMTIPKNTTDTYTQVFVAIDRDGMILAAQEDQSNIYVINPDDGSISKTITVESKVVAGGIQAMAAGDIIVKTGPGEFTVISRSGDERSVLANERYVDCSVDQLTDTVYMTCYDAERGMYSVCQVSRNGMIELENIVEYAKSDRSPVLSPSVLTPSGKLVCFDGDEIFVCEKSFVL